MSTSETTNGNHPQNEHSASTIGALEAFYNSPIARMAVKDAMKPHFQQQELEAKVKRLEHENSHDDQTGLLNKKTWKARIAEEVQSGKPFGVIFMDMNGFKAVNDAIGHDRGDDLLKDFGAHLLERFRRQGEVLSHERFFRKPDGDSEEEASIGRFGGDEFGFVVNLSDRGTPDNLTPEERMQIALDYVEQVTGDFVVAQDQRIKDLGFGISIGNSIWDPENPVTASDLFRQADQSMYQVKAGHKALANG